MEARATDNVNLVPVRLLVAAERERPVVSGGGVGRWGAISAPSLVRSTEALNAG